MSNPDPLTPVPEEIAARATQLWMQAGQPPGREQDYRSKAEAELRKDREISVATAKNNPHGERRPGQIAPPA